MASLIGKKITPIGVNNMAQRELESRKAYQVALRDHMRSRIDTELLNRMFELWRISAKALDEFRRSEAEHPQ